jgi:hypothetical protein
MASRSPRRAACTAAGVIGAAGKAPDIYRE